MAIKPMKWSRGKSLCTYCGVHVATTGDHVVPDCLYTEEERRAIPNLMTVPACADCNVDKSRYDAPLQHYLLVHVDRSNHPQAQQVFGTSMQTAVITNRVRLLDRFYEGAVVPEFTPNGIYLGDNYAIPIDFEPVRRGLVYLVRGLHSSVLGEVKRDDEVGVKVIERDQREAFTASFIKLGLEDWHPQGDQFAAAWVSWGATHVYWLVEFFKAVQFLGRSAKTHPLYGPPVPQDLTRSS